MNHVELGRDGEEAAARYLQERGCRILAKRARLRYGELDLVVLDGATVVFVEVKSRRTVSRGRPEEAVDSRKQRQLARLAVGWLALHPRWREAPIRFDVVALTGQPGQWRIKHMPDAFRP